MPDAKAIVRISGDSWFDEDQIATLAVDDEIEVVLTATVKKTGVEHYKKDSKRKFVQLHTQDIRLG
jgi:hypothetical protein